jgi:hypothetical protein
VCDCSVFVAAVLPTERQAAAARQSVSELIQNGFKFRLTFQKSTFFGPEEAASRLERCKNTDHKQSFFWFGLEVPVDSGVCIRRLDQLLQYWALSTDVLTQGFQCKILTSSAGHCGDGQHGLSDGERLRVFFQVFFDIWVRVLNPV